MNLTVGYITARYQPEMEWFLDSLRLQMKPDDQVQVIIVDGLNPQRKLKLPDYKDRPKIYIVPPMPNIWQGQHKVRQVNNWAASAARNTAICLCKTDWIAFCDDRCILVKNWLNCIRDAMRHGYCVAGSYEKRIGMVVKDGIIKSNGTVAGKDSRADQTLNIPGPMKAPGEWLFGCTLALPLEWALVVNGYDTSCDGMGFEDCFFGLHLVNAGYPVFYDKRMKIIEDRTFGLCEPVMYKTDKGISPDDKSHGALKLLRHRKEALHSPWPINLKSIREDLAQGKPFPIPPKKIWHDWWDNSIINEI